VGAPALHPTGSGSYALSQKAPARASAHAAIRARIPQITWHATAARYPLRTTAYIAALPNPAFYDQGGAASGAPRAGLCLGRPAQRARAVPPLAPFPKGQTHQTGAAVFLAVHCPAHGRCVEGGPAGRRPAIGYADPGPGGHSPGFGAGEEDRDRAVDRDISADDLLGC
jgi:hypothetical protein